jgi:hypothetical protein
VRRKHIELSRGSWKVLDLSTPSRLHRLIRGRGRFYNVPAISRRFQGSPEKEGLVRGTNKGEDSFNPIILLSIIYA